MAISSKIKIMISSRCNDRFPLAGENSRPLSEIRVQLKREIESVTIFKQAIYDVWINEKEEEDGSRQAWDHCMDQARDCDVFIALYNGNAGWADTSGTIGICHAEFEAANDRAPGKVFIVNIYEPGAKSAPVRATDLAFQNDIQRLRKFDARAAIGEKQLLEVVRKTVADSTVKMVQRGVRDANRGTSYVGPALDWSRLNYARRVEEMREALPISARAARRYRRSFTAELLRIAEERKGPHQTATIYGRAFPAGELKNADLKIEREVLRKTLQRSDFEGSILVGGTEIAWLERHSLWILHYHLLAIVLEEDWVRLRASLPDAVMVKAHFDAKYGWSDGLIAELTPA